MSARDGGVASTLGSKMGRSQTSAAGFVSTGFAARRMGFKEILWTFAAVQIVFKVFFCDFLLPYIWILKGPFACPLTNVRLTWKGSYSAC